MKLRGIEFGRVMNAGGARNFFGEGYWFHEFWEKFGLDFSGSTFVAKTTTLEPRAGNMPLRDNSTEPKEWFPKCIVVKPIQGVVLNSVGLSGPGAKWILEQGLWQERREPFFISFMSVAETPSRRLFELGQFASLLGSEMPNFLAPFGLKMNFSCPNVGLDPSKLADEALEALSIAEVIGVPLIPKFNVEIPVELAAMISQHQSCDAICVSNTIPWGKFPEWINWKKIFGSDVSPLAHLGGGGLSGRPLLPIVLNWVERFREIEPIKPLIVGGGILSQEDAGRAIRLGASMISLGSVYILRPWRVQGIIRFANERRDL